MEFLQALARRRSIYNLTDAAVVPDALLEARIGDVVRLTPSAFHSQSQRVVLLLNANHAQLWDIVRTALAKIVPAQDFPKTAAKIAGFVAGHGTILFFDDQTVTQGLMAKYPLYKDSFAVWYQQQAGMLQSNIWVALADIGYGASLQHYSELIEAEVRKVFAIPDGWQLLAQMPFGKIAKSAKTNTYLPLDQRFLVITK
ncbi:MAG: nitroreductase family protein [bacterium]